MCFETSEVETQPWGRTQTVEASQACFGVACLLRTLYFLQSLVAYACCKHGFPTGA